MNEKNDAFVRLVKTLCVEKGISMRELAKMLRWARSVLYAKFKKPSCFYIEDVRQLVEILGITKEQLWSVI